MAKEEVNSPWTVFIDSTTFPQCGADPGATYTVMLALSDVARCSTV